MLFFFAFSFCSAQQTVFLCNTAKYFCNPCTCFSHALACKLRDALFVCVPVCGPCVLLTLCNMSDIIYKYLMMQSVNHSTACFVCATPGSNTLAGDIFDARSCVARRVCVGVCVRKVCRVCQCLKRWLSKYSAHSPLVVAPMCVRSLACVRVCVCVYVRLARAIVCAVEMRTIWPGSGYGGCDEHAAVSARFR